jgi:polyhydroxybutyrate depolymerase
MLVVLSVVMLGCSSERTAPTTDLAASVPPSAQTSVETVVDSVADTAPDASVDTVETNASITTAGDRAASRPFTVNVPKSYDASVPAPLLVVLHGYTASGSSIRAAWNLDAVAEQHGVLTVYPDGTKDTNGQPFWNATDACCNLGGANVDDSTYLIELIDSVSRDYSIDPKRIYVAGHSNGGFMSYRMACQHADRIAAIVSLAGATFADTTACRPSQPVSVAQVHGTSDFTISYTGGDIVGHTYPPAKTTVASWAAYDGCSTTTKAARSGIDLEAVLEGPDTSVEAFVDCPKGIDVELWTVDGGEHSPQLGPAYATNVIEFLLAHPKP